MVKVGIHQDSILGSLSSSLCGRSVTQFCSGVRWDLYADDLVIIADLLGECQQALDMEKVREKEVSGAGKTD